MKSECSAIFLIQTFSVIYSLVKQHFINIATFKFCTIDRVAKINVMQESN